MCMCVSYTQHICIDMYAQMYRHIHTAQWVYIYVYGYVCVSMCAYNLMRIHICIYTCVYLCTMHIHILLYVVCFNTIYIVYTYCL